MTALQPQWRFQVDEPGMPKPIVWIVDADTERDAKASIIRRLQGPEFRLSAFYNDWQDILRVLPSAELALSSGRGLPLIDVAAWAGEPPVRRSFWGDWLPARQTTMLTGMGGVGKSLFEQCLFTAIAVGKPFLGMATEQCNTLYVTCEDDQDELWRRQEAIERALGIERADWLGRFWPCSLVDQQGGTALAALSAEGKLEPTDRWHEMVDTCNARKIGLYAFDNATDAMAGDLNDATQVAAFIGMMTRLAAAQDGAAMLIHHPNKREDEFANSMAFHNKVRSRWFMGAGDPEIDPDARFLTNPKSNYGPAGGRIDFRWHEGAFVRAEELPAETGKELVKAAKLRGAQAAFLKCLQALSSGREVGPNVGPNYAPARFAQMPGAKGYSKHDLARAMEQLFHSGAIETREIKRKGKDTKTIIAEAGTGTSEPPSEPVPNTGS